MTLLTERSMRKIYTGIDGGEEGETLPNVEPRGQYVNKYTYYVSNDLLDDWVELPLA